MQTDRFRTLLDKPGPFATVYYDDSHNTAEAAAASDLIVRTDERFGPDDGIAAVLRYDEFSAAEPNVV